MKKAKEYAEEIYEALMTNDHHTIRGVINQVFIAVAHTEVKELMKKRHVKTDNGLISIYKEQRRKYGGIAERVNEMSPRLLSIKDFDEVIIEMYPEIYGWYKSNVLS